MAMMEFHGSPHDIIFRIRSKQQQQQKGCLAKQDNFQIVLALKFWILDNTVASPFDMKSINLSYKNNCKIFIITSINNFSFVDHQ